MLLFLGFIRLSLPTINHNDMLYSGFFLGSGKKHTDVAFWRSQSLLQYGFQDTKLVSTHYQLLGSAVSLQSAVQHSGAKHFHGLHIAFFMTFLPGNEDHGVQRLLLFSQSQTKFLKIESLSNMMYADACMCVLTLSSYAKVSFPRRKLTWWCASKSVWKMKTTFQRRRARCFACITEPQRERRAIEWD